MKKCCMLIYHFAVLIVIVLEYAYDAWGNVLDISGTYASTLGQNNPIRYRGYYYDSETSLYYLNS